MLLHGVFNGDVLAIRRSIVARYGFAKALRGVRSAVAKKLKEKREAKKMQEELISIANCSKPSVNQQRVKKDGISRLHGEISAGDAHVTRCCTRAACERKTKQDWIFKIKEGLHTPWATSRSCPAWRHDTLCSHLLPELLRKGERKALQHRIAFSRTFPVRVVVSEKGALVRSWKDHKATIGLVDVLQSGP